MLVVEDSIVNQRVAVGLLKRLGITADVAANGREALDILERQRYDAILMDCLMPEMDGYAATEELRRRELASGQRRTPIIALTASALRSDRDRCAEAGMDDFLTKPIQGHNLRATLDHWLNGQSTTAESASPLHREMTPGKGRPEAEPAVSDPPTHHPDAGVAAVPSVTIDSGAIKPILDVQALGQPGLFNEMLALFRTEGASRVVALRAAVADGDGENAHRLAHTLHGEALSWGASELARCCRQLEEAFNSDGGSDMLDNPRAALPLVAELEQVFAATVEALDAIRSSTGPAMAATSA